LSLGLICCKLCIHGSPHWATFCEHVHLIADPENKFGIQRYKH
jgi:hypothetical protein